MILPAIIVWVFALKCSADEIENVFLKLKYIFLLSVIYGLVQKFYGYLPQEMAWITNGIGMVGEAGYFVRPEDLRAFSFYAGVAEFGLISSIFLFISIKRTSVMLFIACFIGIIISGSRGMMVSIFIALNCSLLYRYFSPKKTVVFGFLLSIFIYIILAFILPMTRFVEGPYASRLLVYGTYGARVQVLLDFIGNLTLTNLLIGGITNNNVLDNFYLFLIDKFGLVFLVFFIIAMIRSSRSAIGVYVSTIVISYSLYADSMLSVYFVYPAFLFVFL
jgi:hypothetical protein